MEVVSLCPIAGVVLTGEPSIPAAVLRTDVAGPGHTLRTPQKYLRYFRAFCFRLEPNCYGRCRLLDVCVWTGTWWVVALVVPFERHSPQVRKYATGESRISVGANLRPLVLWEVVHATQNQLRPIAAPSAFTKCQSRWCMLRFRKLVRRCAHHDILGGHDDTLHAA